MQATNMYNSQNGMGQQVGFSQPGLPQNNYGQHNSMYTPPQPTPYPNSTPWDTQNWREVPMPTQQQNAYHIPFRGMSISDPLEIKPKDVPMDGQMSFFPMDDHSCIYAKIWTDDGRLRTFRFIPEIESASNSENQRETFDPQELVDSIFAPVDKKLSAFDKKFDKIEKSITSILDQLTPKTDTKEAAKK